MNNFWIDPIFEDSDEDEDNISQKEETKSKVCSLFLEEKTGGGIFGRVFGGKKEKTKEKFEGEDQKESESSEEEYSDESSASVNDVSV